MVTSQVSVPKASSSDALICWLPLGCLAPLALMSGQWLAGWPWMWVLAVSIFAGFKWATLTSALESGPQPCSHWRPWLYLFCWPGMNARGFLAGSAPARPAWSSWFWAAAKTLFGACLLWVVARACGEGLLAGWVGMVGLISLLHFGSFDLLARFWQSQGIDAPPLMRAPILAGSLGEFWGRRWNSGFRDLVFGLWFGRLKKRVGARAATLVLFLASGVIHDVVISLPARGGYGLPTAYFALQGVGLLAEHARGSAIARWRGRWQGKVWTWLIVAGPVFWLFHPPFVRGVILPFMRAMHAL